MNFDHYVLREAEMYSAHQKRVLERKASGNPMSPDEEVADAKETLRRVDQMWEGANEGFLAVLRMQKDMMENGIQFGIKRMPYSKIRCV